MPSTFEEADEEPAAPQLTDRKLQIIKSLARGNKQIARSLTISEKTVRNHVSNIYAIRKDLAEALESS